MQGLNYLKNRVDKAIKAKLKDLLILLELKTILSNLKTKKLFSLNYILFKTYYKFWEYIGEEYFFML